MSSRSQGSLLSNTEDPGRECKKHCKVINLRSGKNVDVTKKRLELNSSQEPPQDERMLQQPSHQDPGASGQAAATLEGNQPITAEEEVETPVVTTYNKSKEQRLVPPEAVQQFWQLPHFPQRFQKQKQENSLANSWKCCSSYTSTYILWKHWNKYLIM